MTTYDSGEQKVVRQEFHLVHLDVVPQLVHLQSTLVVDVDELFLRDSKEALVVQPPNRATRLLEMQLRVESTRVPVEGADVTLLAGNGEMSALRQRSNKGDGRLTVHSECSPSRTGQTDQA